MEKKQQTGKNKVLIGMDASQSFRFYLADTTPLVQQAHEIHQTTPLAIAGLGRVLTGTGLMSLMLKDPRDKLTVIFHGDGPAKQILATAKGNGQVKGYIANPRVDLPLTSQGKLAVGQSLGIGDLTVIKDMGLKEPYSGKIALVNGEIAQDLTAYYYISEQKNTMISLGVKVGKDGRIDGAGGLFLQLLPQNDEEVVKELEDLSRRIRPMTTLLEEQKSLGKGTSSQGLLEGVMEEIFYDFPEKYKPQILEYKEIQWNCDCSKEKTEQALIAMGAQEIKDIIKEQGQAELYCHFCGNRYLFSESELTQLLLEMKG